jgi:protein-S-isoprenylcysteine O-methyltransferase Ste14
MKKNNLALSVYIVFAIVFLLSLAYVTYLALDIQFILAPWKNPIIQFIDWTINFPFLYTGYSVSTLGHIIGWICMTIVLFMILSGFLLKRKDITLLGGFASFLPTLGYFASGMFFLHGLGALRVLYIPLWGQTEMMRLGDIFLLPYSLVIIPFTNMEYDHPVVPFAPIMVVGLVIFFLGMITWFYGKHQGKQVVDFGIYRFSRHPQYLGWMIWMYGFMIAADQVVYSKGMTNYGASLPWMVSALVVVCVAVAEEMELRKKIGAEYIAYQKKTAFLLPVPKWIYGIIALPYRIIFRKKMPESNYELVFLFILYLGIFSALSWVLIYSRFPRIDHWWTDGVWDDYWRRLEDWWVNGHL